MASNDPLNNPGFSLPSLQDYQSLMRQQAQASLGPNASGWAKLAQSSMFDLVRSTGYLSPTEKKIGAGAAIQDAANQEAAATGETDPTKLRIAALTTMVSKFNQLGLTEFSAKAMPELQALQQATLERRKLKAEAGDAESKERVDVNTEGARILTPVYQNQLTQAQKDEAIANKDFTAGAKTDETKALAAEKAGEYQNYINPNNGSMVSILKSNAEARAAITRAGYVEDNINLNPTTPGDLKPTKQEATKLEDTMFQADRQLDQIRTLAGQFKPEYLEMTGKVANWARGLADKSGFVKLSPEQRASYDGFMQFRAGSIDALNQYIHMITGAQMSQGEADRIRLAIQDAQNDGPAAYVAKMRSVARTLVQTRERARQYLNNGGNVMGPGGPDGKAWDLIHLPEVSDADVDQFLGRTFGVTSKSAPSSATGTTGKMTDEQLVDHYNQTGK